MIRNSLQNLFNPRSIAVVGVSQDSEKLGSVVFNNIKSSEYSGELYAVNPNYDSVQDQKSFPKVSDIEEDVELAIVVIPAVVVPEVIEDIAKKGVKNLIIISGGFREIGEEGLKLEQRIVETAASANMNLLGPNCLGIILPGINLNASFAGQVPENGNIAFLSQSGAINTALLDMANDQHLGFSHFISLGNKAGITENDLLEEWLQDDRVKVIGMYLEEIDDGKDLVDLLHKYPKKPVVILKPGASKEARKAMASHTGSLAGTDLHIKTAFKQAGIIQVDSVERLFNTLKLLSWSRIPTSDKVAIVTNAGGPGIMATDMVATSGLKLDKLSPKVQQALKEALPETASVANPVDIVGDALVDRYRSALKILEDEDDLETIFVILTPQLVTQVEETARLIISQQQITSKIYIPIFLGGTYVSPGLHRMYDNEIPAFRYAEEAISAVAEVVEYSKTDLSQSKRTNSETQYQSHGEYKQQILKLLAEGKNTVPHELARKIAKEAGLTLPEEQVVAGFPEAEDFLINIGGKVVLKATAEDLPHKTESKAVYLDIESSQELSSAYDSLVATIREASGNDQPHVLIQEQITIGQELLLGINRDGGSNVYTEDGKGFGHIMVFGKGGIFTEVYKDIAAALIPMTISEAENLVDTPKVSKIINGYRGSEPLARQKLIEAVLAMQYIALNYPEISSMDINPLAIDESRVVAVDVKMFIEH